MGRSSNHPFSIRQLQFNSSLPRPFSTGLFRCPTLHRGILRPCNITQSRNIETFGLHERQQRHFQSSVKDDNIHPSKPEFYTKYENVKCSQQRVLDLLNGRRNQNIPSQASGGPQMVRPEDTGSYKEGKRRSVIFFILFGSVISVCSFQFTRTRLFGQLPVQAQSYDRSHPSNTRTGFKYEENQKTESTGARPKVDDQSTQTASDVNNSGDSDTSMVANAAGPSTQRKSIRKSSTSSPPKIVEDPDPEFDELAEAYKRELKESETLNEIVQKNEEEHDKESRMQKILNILFLKSGDSGDRNFRRREAKRLAHRFRPSTPPPRTAARITIGASQVFQEKTRSDRFDLGIIKAHQTKFFYAGVMDGYNGWQMAEYIRRVLAQRLEESINGSPLFLIRDTVTAAFARLDEELKGTVKGVTDLKLTKALSMGSCVLVTLIDTNSIIIGNLGTSKAVISREGKPFRLSRWHSADTLYEQRAYVKSAQREDNALKCAKQKDVERKVTNLLSVPFWMCGTQGYDTMYLDCLIKGMAPATRSLGHFQLKDPEMGRLFQEMEGSKCYPYISHLPTVSVYPRTKYDDFLILATNGFWEAVEEHEAVGIVNETIKNLCETVGTDIARNYAQVAADKLIDQALQNHKVLHARDVIGERQDMTAIVIPLNVDRVVGVPEIDPNIIDIEKSLPLWLKVKNRLFGSVEDIFKVADWNTRLRWLNERSSTTAPGTS